ncbi:MAG: exotoxin [Streptococcus pyogenes]|nr:MAG: exotoxin [Streptococcus pyogenes]
MNKRIRILLVACLVFCVQLLSVNVFADSQPDPTPDQLNKSSKFTGLMENMKYLYDDNFVVGVNVKSTRKFLEHDLIFPIKDLKLKNYESVKTEFNSKDLAAKYQNKNVDVFGSNYYQSCYYSVENQPLNAGKTCMYGGVTEHLGNQMEGKLSNIIVKVYEDNKNTLSFNITTNKKQVTIQELDCKTRNILLSRKNLYEFNNSPYETGYIKFIQSSGDSFWYDMMPEPGGKFDQSKYLMLYSDNKTVDSSAISIDVHLTKK